MQHREAYLANSFYTLFQKVIRKSDEKKHAHDTKSSPFPAAPSLQAFNTTAFRSIGSSLFLVEIQY